MMLIAEGLTKRYGQVEVLKGISLTIAAAEVVSIVGASGAGKTTLLQVLSSLDYPDSGSILVDGMALHNLRGDRLARFRNEQIGFIFQFHHLLPEFTALENICLPAMLAGQSLPSAKPRALELMELLHISHRQDHRPAEMSGGEQQRAAVARALIRNPKVVFADEPSGNLDSQNASELHQLFFDLRQQFGQTFVIVTHNPDFARMADRTIELKDGRIV